MVRLRDSLLFAFALALSSILFCGCGYQMGTCSVLSQYDTICIPYVDGDVDGMLTSSIIREITSSGEIAYCHEGGDLILNARLIDSHEDNVGFRFLRDRNNTLTDQLIPVETRLQAMIQVELVDSCTGCTVLGPANMFAKVDYDHDFNRAGDNSFSLGQLNDLDGAKDASYKPLNRALAKKVVNYLISAW